MSEKPVPKPGDPHYSEAQMRPGVVFHSTAIAAVLSWGELGEYVYRASEALRALERAEALAAKQTEELRVARNRINNAYDHLLRAQQDLGIGANDDAMRRVKLARESLTFTLPEGA
jgi:hypothetical protein